MCPSSPQPRDPGWLVGINPGGRLNFQKTGQFGDKFPVQDRFFSLQPEKNFSAVFDSRRLFEISSDVRKRGPRGSGGTGIEHNPKREGRSEKRGHAGVQAEIWENVLAFLNPGPRWVKSSLTVPQDGIQLMTGSVPRRTPTADRHRMQGGIDVGLNPFERPVVYCTGRRWLFARSQRPLSLHTQSTRSTAERPAEIQQPTCASSPSSPSHHSIGLSFQLNLNLCT